MAQAHSSIVALPQQASVERAADARIELRPFVVFASLLTINVVLAVADLFTLWLDETIGSVQLRESFDVNAERSIPTWFSSTQLFLAHATLLFIAWIETHRRTPHIGYWWFLTAILLVMSVDEIAGFHENGGIVMNKLGYGGDWTVLGAPVAAAVGLIFVPFLLSLPRQIAASFAAAGLLMVLGAVIVEGLHLTILPEEGAETRLRSLLPATEEFLERLSISVFILGLLVYLRVHLGLRGLALK